MPIPETRGRHILPCHQTQLLYMNKIKLSDGTQAISFVGEDTAPKAIVHLSTLMKLAALLPKAKIRDIIAELIDKLGYVQTNSLGLEAYLEVLKDEIAFHESVNLIKEWKPSVFFDVIAISHLSDSVNISIQIDGTNEVINNISVVCKEPQNFKMGEYMMDERIFNNTIIHQLKNRRQPTHSIISHEAEMKLVKEADIQRADSIEEVPSTDATQSVGKRPTETKVP